MNITSCLYSTEQRGCILDIPKEMIGFFENKKDASSLETMMFKMDRVNSYHCIPQNVIKITLINYSISATIMPSKDKAGAIVEPILNFYPYYEDLLITQKKSTTLRLGDQREMYSVGDCLDITVSWDANKNQVRKITRGIITYVESKPINRLTQDDVKGESPDCWNLSAIKYVLGSIYRTIVNDNDIVTVIKWKYLSTA